MPRWTGTWLSGPGVTLRELRQPDTWPGQKTGLPQEGSGSLAPFSVRAFAFFLDLLGSGLVSGLIMAFVHHPTGAQRQITAYVVLALEHVLLVALTGQTVGMRVLGVRVVRLSAPDQVPGFVPALVRTVPLLLSAGLFGFFTKDGRGWHDCIAGTAVVRV